MRTEIEWAELHAPLFLAGSNLQQKLDPKQRQGLKLEYDEVKRHLYVSYKEKTARIPETSVLSMVEAPIGVKGVFATPGPTESSRIVEKPLTPSEAQVESPTSHVFAGPGKGKTGRGGKTKA